MSAVLYHCAYFVGNSLTFESFCIRYTLVLLEKWWTSEIVKNQTIDYLSGNACVSLRVYELGKWCLLLSGGFGIPLSL